MPTHPASRRFSGGSKARMRDAPQRLYLSEKNGTARSSLAFSVPTKSARLSFEMADRYRRYTPWSELRRKVLWTKPLEEMEGSWLVQASVNSASSDSDSSSWALVEESESINQQQ